MAMRGVQGRGSLQVPGSLLADRLSLQTLQPPRCRYNIWPRCIAKRLRGFCCTCRGYTKFTQEDIGTRLSATSPSPPPHRSSSVMSPSGSLVTPAGAALLGHNGALASSSSALNRNAFALPSGLPGRLPSLPGSTSAPLPAVPLAKRNSLPPLRCTFSGTVSGSSDPLISPTTGSGAAAAANAAASGGSGGGGGGGGGSPVSLSGSNLAPVGPTSRAESCSGLSTLTVNDPVPHSIPPATSSTVRRLTQQYSGGLRHSLGHVPAFTPTSATKDDTAVAQLASVCNAQVTLYRWAHCSSRLQWQPTYCCNL